jgi:hypothetical protein
VLLKSANGQIWQVPREWTDLVAPDPRQDLGKNRVLFHIHDLIALERLVADFSIRNRQEKE